MSEALQKQARLCLAELQKVLMGKESEIRLALTCLFARGHLLIEDLPGLGKTTLAQALARCLGLAHQRVQFTSDLLPADVLGTTVFDASQNRFTFHPGPVFTELLLADEINRSTPKTQSALLEAMEERQVSLDGQVHRLPESFFVIATQNPSTQFGTFPLPESQLDRFLMRIHLGYPDPAVERALLTHGDTRVLIDQLTPALNPGQLHAIQRSCNEIHASAELIDYLQRLLSFSRDPRRFSLGISPRGGLALLRAARAHAWLAGRSHVVPEDIQTVLGPVVGHRIRRVDQNDELSTERLVELMLEEVDVIR